jgi:hypothetical protein
MTLRHVIAVLRILGGAGLLALGISLLRDAGFLFGGLIHRLEEFGRPFAFYRSFLERFVEFHQELLAYLLAGGILFVGVSLLLGLLVSWGAVAGAILAVNFGLATTAGNWLGTCLWVAVAALLLLMGRRAAGLTWGLDAWLVERISAGLVLFPLRVRPPE